MSDDNKIRLAHELLDEVNAREDLTPEQVGVLRSFLPKRPKPVTLEQVFRRANAAWANARGNEWLREEEDLEAALLALRDDLSRLINEPKPADPALPAGMRLAEHEKYGRVVVSTTAGKSGNYMIFILDNSNGWGSSCTYADCSSLTFIDAPPAHPEFLEAEEDYENAPAGTIVAKDSYLSWTKQEDGDWDCTTGISNRSDVMTLTGGRHVLRWGWGK